jgi:hypothetical protein
MADVRFTVRQMMLAVAIIAVSIYLISEMENGGCMPPLADRPQGVLTVVAVAGALCIGAIRYPLVSLAIGLVLWLVSPTLHDGSGWTLCEGSYLLGWIIGAPIGWVSRRLKQTGNSSKLTTPNLPHSNGRTRINGSSEV